MKLLKGWWSCLYAQFLYNHVSSSNYKNFCHWFMTFPPHLLLLPTPSPLPFSNVLNLHPLMRELPTHSMMTCGRGISWNAVFRYKSSEIGFSINGPNIGMQRDIGNRIRSSGELLKNELYMGTYERWFRGRITAAQVCQRPTSYLARVSCQFHVAKLCY